MAKEVSPLELKNFVKQNLADLNTLCNVHWKGKEPSLTESPAIPRKIEGIVRAVKEMHARKIPFRINVTGLPSYVHVRMAEEIHRQGVLVAPTWASTQRKAPQKANRRIAPRRKR